MINSQGDAFKYIVYRKKELIDLKYNYFSKYPLLSKKSVRLELLEDFYKLRVYSNLEKTNDLVQFNN